MPVTDLLCGTAQLLGRSSSCNPSMGVAKAQRTRGLSSSYQSNFLRSYHEFKHKSWSFIFRISTKHQLQNFNQTSASRLNLKFTILSRISTKIQLHNLYKTSATKYWPNSSFKFCLNFNFKILTIPCAQSLNKSLALWTILTPQLPNLQQTVANTILNINISNSNNLNKFWVGIFTRQDHINQVY